MNDDFVIGAAFGFILLSLFSILGVLIAIIFEGRKSKFPKSCTKYRHITHDGCVTEGELVGYQSNHV